MGIGHRVYKTLDPRAPHLQTMAIKLSEKLGEPKWIRMSERIAQLMKEKKNLNANVDFYSATVYYSLGIPTDLFTPIFAIARTLRLVRARSRAARRQPPLPAAERIRRRTGRQESRADRRAAVDEHSRERLDFSEPFVNLGEMKSDRAASLVRVCACPSWCGRRRPKSRSIADPALYGEYPKNYQEIITNWLETKLVDPPSAQIEWTSAPKPADLPEKKGGKPLYGYLVEFKVNSRNRFGAYTGKQKHGALIRDGQVIKGTGFGF